MSKLKVKRFYNYSEEDGSYIDYEDIQQDVWVLQIENKEYYTNPAFSTDKEPLEPKDGFLVRFNVETSNWEYVENTKSKDSRVSNTNTSTDTTQMRIKNDIAYLKGVLSSTDWYVIRKLETGEEIPEQITNDRKASRSKISDLRNELRLIATRIDQHRK